MPASFKCPRCDRSFGMAAHLARHMNTMHVSGAKKAGKSKPANGRRRGRGPGRPKGSLNRRSGFVAPEGPSKILSDISAYREELIQRRSSIEHQIQSVENALNMMSGALAVPAGPGRKRRGRVRPRGSMGRLKLGRPPGATGKRGRRGPREGSLKQMIVRVLGSASKPLSPSEIADGVVKVGYKTTASNLTKAVSNALPQISQVKKAGRGIYRA